MAGLANGVRQNNSPRRATIAENYAVWPSKKFDVSCRSARYPKNQNTLLVMHVDVVGYTRILNNYVLFLALGCESNHLFCHIFCAKLVLSGKIL